MRISDWRSDVCSSDLLHQQLDAGIENALGLAADPEQGNVVTILNRGADFARAKGANVKLLMEARDGGRINVMTETSPSKVEPGSLVLDTRDGRSEEHTSELQSLMRISYAVFCLKKKNTTPQTKQQN